MNSADKRGPDSSQTRKSYRSPVLQAYGNIRALTHSVSMNNMLDGMATGNTKTS